jgi:dihydroorotase
MNKTLIYNALIINEGKSFKGSVLISGNIIEEVFENAVPESVFAGSDIINAEGCLLLPGVIDDHVHFREPGLTHKAELSTESAAAIAGGVTSFMEMPNTIPQTTTLDIWGAKMALAEEKSLANYSFYLGATNENIDQLKKADFSRVCGVKVFMGSSTGNMLVDNEEILINLFREIPSVIAVHAESESVIKENKKKYIEQTGGILPVKYHPLIRSAEACYESTARAVELAAKYNSRLHVLHLSTAKELSLFEKKPLKTKKITSEACLLHLWFDDQDYSEYGNLIKCNPAVKTSNDKNTLRSAVSDGLIDIVATDHAPHLLSEKSGDCLTAASGSPSIQFSLSAMLDLASKGHFTKETVVEKMCHAPAIVYKIEKRGFIRKKYFADIVLVKPDEEWTLSSDKILSKCGWSPFTGITFSHIVKSTWINGVLVFDNGSLTGKKASNELKFIG